MHGNWHNDMHDGFGWGWIPMVIMMLLAWGSLIWLAVADRAMRAQRTTELARFRELRGR